jgi:hypothetical protein
VITWHELNDDARRLLVEASFEGATFGELLRNLPGEAPDVSRAIAATEQLLGLGLISIHERQPSNGWVVVSPKQAIEAIRVTANWIAGDGPTNAFSADVTRRGEDMMSEVNLRLENSPSGGLVVWDGPDGGVSRGQLRMA